MKLMLNNSGTVLWMLDLIYQVYQILALDETWMLKNDHYIEVNYNMFTT